MTFSFRIAIVLVIFYLGFASSHAQPPNVIVILADDIGTGDISHYQRHYGQNVVVETPHIDKLAREGMFFTDAHSPAALCAPSRYSIFTGNSTYRSYQPWGVWGAYQRSPIEEEDLTLGELMQQAGYHTGFFGKWHMGGDWKRKSNPDEIYRSPRVEPEMDIDLSERLAGGPMQNGFDYAFTFPSGIQDVPYAVFENNEWYPLTDSSELTLITQKKMDKLKVKLDKDEGLGDSAWDPHDMGPLLANKAVGFITAQSQTAEPFFMYYCSEAVHLPHTPPTTLNGTTIAGSYPVPHMDMIKELDEQVGQMATALKEKGLYDNTLIIITSDNGGLGFRQTLATGHRPSGIFSGHKNSIQEGGHRVPLIASWPGHIDTNMRSDAAVQALDIHATLADLLDQQIGSSQARDSRSMLPLLEGKTKPIRKQMIIQGGTSREMAYYEENWKLVVQFDPKDKTDKTRKPKALYNLKNDVREKNNLLETENKRARKMFARFNEMRDT
ncbi:sulfatase family protein [Reichenbachiella agariperforans]|uniref:sulfatase family protein n=1 Tax=Reichenbachiella agariperforans TaxID=156994 RepID=UPI001C085A1C|nr:arylsulfatase [Reichenbachiella agariperforans]MBU2912609.1 arylsulfatase [Reichenbachiella agariperforans]